MNLTDATAYAYRAGFNVMWKHAGQYMKRKGIKRPGEFRKDNIHGGRLWASKKECNMTDNIAGNIIERVYESGQVGLDQLKQVRHSLSYAYYLTHRVQGENFPEVYAQWKTFNLQSLPGVKRPVKPKRIPTPLNLKKAFKKKWTRRHTLSLPEFLLGLLACWDSAVFGLRPNVDTDKVKKSEIHEVNANEGYGWTQMLGGRSKLHGQKRGTRPWKVFRVCTCKEEHLSPPEPLELSPEGNPEQDPAWNTCCPVAAMEFLKICQGDKFKIYRKWNPRKGTYSNLNRGDIATCSLEWLYAQEIPGPFDRNSGRKSLSRWLEKLNVPYSEQLHIHGDLEGVWRAHYQGKLLKSGLKTREQAPDSDQATKALRRFAKWLHDTEEPKPSIRQQLNAILANLD